MEKVIGKIVAYNEKTQTMTIEVKYDNVERMAKRMYSNVIVGLEDGRFLTEKQRTTIYSIMSDITAHVCGEVTKSDLDQMKYHLKVQFITTQLSALEQKLFSLSVRDEDACDETTAYLFIDYLIEFVLANEIPLTIPLYDKCSDIAKYVYICLMHKKCVICGQHAELHHFDAIGMGRNRDVIYQVGMMVIPFCREHHSEAELRGKIFVKELWHLIPIPLTVEIAKVYKLTKKNIER